MLIDSGAEVCVCAPELMDKYKIPYRKRLDPTPIGSADGTLIEGAGKYVTRETQLLIRDKKAHGYRVAPIQCEVFNVDRRADIIVGMDWLEQFGKNLSFEALREKRPVEDIITFRDDLSLEDEVIEIKMQYQYDQLVEEAINIAMISVTFLENSGYKVSVVAINK